MPHSTACLVAPSHNTRAGLSRRQTSHRRPSPEGSTVANRHYDRPSPEEGYSRWTDEALVRRYRDHGDPDAFGTLVARYERPLHRYLVRYLGDATLADDVLQDTFLQVHAKCGLYRDGGAVRAWLYSIATHRAVDALRRAGRHAGIPSRRPADSAGGGLACLVELMADDTPEPLAELQEAERRRWVRDSVAGLSEPLRQVLILTYYQELPYRDVAEVLGIPLGTVKSRLHQAVAKLREKALGAHLAPDA